MGTVHLCKVLHRFQTPSNPKLFRWHCIRHRADLHYGSTFENGMDRKPLKRALSSIIEGKSLDEQIDKLLEADVKKLTDAGMKKMIPMFVSGTTKNETHDCGHCKMFVPETGKCTIVSGDIKANGTCMYQAPSKDHSKPADEHDTKMSKDQAQYAEMPVGTPINCGTCEFYEDAYCKLWKGAVKENDCCMAHDSKLYIK